MVIRDGRIYTPQGFYDGDIVVEDGKIQSLTKSSLSIQADKVLDARGNLVLPGMIDMHVHFRDPGFPDREDFQSGTSAAAAGGVTTVADMPNTVPSVTSVEALREKVEIADRKALIDFALIAGAGELSADMLVSLAKGGVVGYKTFMIARFKELAASDGQMLDNFETIAETGLPCMIHAENEDIVSRGIEKAKALGRVDPIAHSEFRPPIAEVEATARTIMLAGETDVHLHICHMSTKGAAKVLGWAKKRRRKVTGETSANYLLLNSEVMKKVGPYAKIDPPLRSPQDQEALWEALNGGVIDVIASDHAPYPKEDKEKGWQNIYDAPSGGTGVETTLPLMLDCVNRGLITLERLVETFAVNPAKIMGLYPRKGVLAPGSDADIIIVDPMSQFVIKGEKLHSKQKITALEGYRGKGRPLTTIVRGKVIMEGGKVVGKPGFGEYLKPLH
jgi:dihydroorotase (multifunctional complex type)